MLCVYVQLLCCQLEAQFFGVLCSVRMLSTSIYKQLFVHLAAQPVLRQHTLYGALYHRYRAALQQVAGSFFAQATGVAAKVLVHFLVQLVAGKFYLVGIDHYHIIATVHMGRVIGFGFATQHSGYAGTHATNGLIGTVHNVPRTLYGSRIRMLGSKV